MKKIIVLSVLAFIMLILISCNNQNEQLEFSEITTPPTNNIDFLKNDNEQVNSMHGVRVYVQNEDVDGVFFQGDKIDIAIEGLSERDRYEIKLICPNSNNTIYESNNAENFSFILSGNEGLGHFDLELISKQSGSVKSITVLRNSECNDSEIAVFNFQPQIGGDGRIKIEDLSIYEDLRNVKGITFKEETIGSIELLDYVNLINDYNYHPLNGLNDSNIEINQKDKNIIFGISSGNNKLDLSNIINSGGKITLYNPKKYGINTDEDFKLLRYDDNQNEGKRYDTLVTINEDELFFVVDSFGTYSIVIEENNQNVSDNIFISDTIDNSNIDDKENSNNDEIQIDPTPAITSYPSTTTLKTKDGKSLFKTDIEIYRDGTKILTETPVYSTKDELLVPAKKVLKALNVLNMSTFIDEYGNQSLWGQKWLGLHNWESVHIIEGFDTQFIGDGTYESGIHISYLDGDLLIPTKFIHDVMNVEIEYNENNNRIDIKTGKTVDCLSLQKNTEFNAKVLERKSSKELEDNRMGSLVSNVYAFNKQQLEENLPLYPKESGLKWWSMTLNNQDWIEESTSMSEFEIDPLIDQFYTRINNMGVNIIYNLIFKDRDYVKEGGVLGVPRFKNEGEIQRYLEFVRFTVRHFKGRVKMYELWNEPNIKGIPQFIEPEDYIKITKLVVPIIREEDPKAKIAVGQTTGYEGEDSREYINALVTSDIMPLVDVVTIHGLFWDSPEFNKEYYYSYPDLLDNLKNTAWEHGFKGEFWSSEGNYSAFDQIPSDMKGRIPEYSYLTTTKYMVRGSITNLAKGFAGGSFGITNCAVPGETTFGNLCTLMAGAKPDKINVSIDCKGSHIVDYSFTLTNGDKYVVVWNDIIADDNYSGIEANIKIAGLTGCKVTAIDPIHSFEQEIVTNENANGITINNFIIKDYPIFIKLH